MITSKTMMTAVAEEIVEEVVILSMEKTTAVGESAQNAIRNRRIVDQPSSRVHQ
jgi:hypothetical protein